MAELRREARQEGVTLPDTPSLAATINKWAAGISDTLALGLLNEAIGLGLPVVAVPFPNIALAQHPAFRRSLADLRGYGVRLLFDPDAYPLPTPTSARPAETCSPGER
jgi:hypothetical protein